MLNRRMRGVTERDARALANADAQTYVEHFVGEYTQLAKTMKRFGVPLAAPDCDADYIAQARRKLTAAGARMRNDGKSIVYGALSPACERCRTGVRSVSEFISLACNRSCWFCFNPNQYDYDRFRHNRKNWKAELDAFNEQMGGLDFIGLTGGEPMLYPDETLDFFRTARGMSPHAHLRLYTSGLNIDTSFAHKLADAGLNEIRFSIKLDENPASQEAVFDTLRSCVGIIDAVMVEMPVIPGTHDDMARILRALDDAGAFGINLLEFCFPLHNAEAYRARNLSLVAQPYRIPYDYGYAGTLPVAGSEALALQLMLEEIERGTHLGLHYCSLENKNTAQIYEQNAGGKLDIPNYRFSQRTFFYETVRAFDVDAAIAAEMLDAKSLPYAIDEQGAVQFSPAHLSAFDLSDATAPKLFLASAVIEQGDDGRKRFREVGLQVLEAGDEQLVLNGEDIA